MEMSNLYMKVDKIELASEGTQVLDLDEHDESIRKLLLSICRMTYDGLESAFGTRNLENILHDHTISEIREKYDEWKNRPKIGDEVKCFSHVGIVISYAKIAEKDYVRVLTGGENSIYCFPTDKVKKTSRHFDNVSIEEIGEYLGEPNE